MLCSAERAFNKLARTFTTQLEALKRYRSKGDQTVRVEHVTVNEGGQAIVGSITTGEAVPDLKQRVQNNVLYVVCAGQQRQNA